MRPCSKHHVLVLLSSLLTAAASGDDFCLSRLVAGSLPLAGEGLPLDDPNQDFLEATDSVSLRGLESRSHDGNGATDFGPATPSCSRHAGSCPALMATAAVTHRPPRTGPNPPLRC
jgi:hypothetical protein